MSKTLTSRIMKSTLQSSHRAFCLQTTSAHRADVVAMIDSFIVCTHSPQNVSGGRSRHS